MSPLHVMLPSAVMFPVQEIPEKLDEPDPDYNPIKFEIKEISPPKMNSIQ